MADRLRPTPMLLQASAQAGVNLTLAATVWMVSGLTASPLLNSLLPALGALPLLLQLKRHSRGYGLQLLAVLALIGISLAMKPMASQPSLLLLGSYLAVLLFALGQEISILPLQRHLISHAGGSMQRLRSGQEIGALIGNLLAAMLFPALRQFLPALILLLPLAVVAARRDTSDRPSPGTGAAAITLPWSRSCALQGMVMGGLFALLALWVREVDGGKCFDFAMVLAAYGLGRALVRWTPSMHRSLRYLLICALLVLSQWSVPAWLAVMLFIPIGAMAAASDAALVDQLTPLGDAPLRWQVLVRSGAVGGLVGSIGLGLICQLMSLNVALPLVAAGFILLAITQARATASLQP